MEQMSDRHNRADVRRTDIEEKSDDNRTTDRPAMRVVTIGEALPEAILQGAAPRPDVIAPDDISAPTIAALKPDVVLTPLFGPGFDCLDVAHALLAAGYRGQLRAVVSYVPNPALVRREIAACCPGLDFDLIVTGPPRSRGTPHPQ
jgi:hypothetical protein